MRHERASIPLYVHSGFLFMVPCRAASYLALDKTKEAAVDLDEAVQADPNSAPAWAARGQAYERLGDKTKAAASYGRAIALRPKDEAARSGLARTGG